MALDRPKKPSAFVFVLMPFKDTFDDVYKLGISPACQAAGAYCERVDEQVFQGSILQRIYNQISKADIIVSDMTGQNPNVFYETGYAHALGKPVILLTQSSDDIPFDLKHYSHIVYAGKISNLKDELERKIRWHIDNPESDIPAISSLKFYIKGQEITDGAVVGYEFFQHAREYSSFGLSLAVLNTGQGIVDLSQVDLSLVVPEPLLTYNTPGVPLPNGRAILFFQKVGKIAPNGWRKAELRINTERDTFSAESWMNFIALLGRAQQCELTVTSEAGSSISIPFSLDLYDLEERAIALARRGECAAAIRHLERKLSALPEDGGVLYNLACVYSIAGNRDAALANLALAIKEDRKFREQAREDKDFEELWHDETFVQVTEPPPPRRSPGTNRDLE